VSEFLSLSELFTSKRGPENIVAFEKGKPIEWGTFLKHVAGLCRKLKLEPQGQWLVASQSSYAFAVSLCALWQTDNVAILPPNLHPGTLAEIDGEFCGVLTDYSLSSQAVPVLFPTAFSAGARKWKRLDRQKVFLKLFTSGSTGNRKSVPKTLANLEEELAAQEITFGAKLVDCAILSTVSHQHIYGLLFRLLWPLCAGRPFVSETPLLWEELLSARKYLSAVCLVSSPAHLDYACVHKKEKVSFTYQIIFSSGAPLNKRTANVIRKRWGLSIIEVFGSTETGGVGWKIQNGMRSGEFWIPLRGVSVSATAEDGYQLRVMSPFTIASENDGWYAMGEKAKVYSDGRFLTDGRIDRIVKIAGKRLSLDDMELRLNQHSWVIRSALTVFVPANSGRSYVRAVITLNKQGKMGLKKMGRLATNKKLNTELKKYFDAVTLPRYFSYVDVIPVNSQGKISRDALNNLFQGIALEVKR